MFPFQWPKHKDTVVVVTSTNHSQVCLCDKSRDHKQIVCESSLIMAGNTSAFQSAQKTALGFPGPGSCHDFPAAWAGAKTISGTTGKPKEVKPRTSQHVPAKEHSVQGRGQPNKHGSPLWDLACMKNHIAKFSINLKGVCSDSPWSTEQPTQSVQTSTEGCS